MLRRVTAAITRSMCPETCAQAGTAVGQRGRPTTSSFGLLGSVRHVLYGPSFEEDEMDALPNLAGDDVSYDVAMPLEDVQTDFVPIPGGHLNDPRLCIQIDAPHPVTIQGFALGFHLDEEVKA